MEERNVSISNAKMRWNFLKKQNWKAKDAAAAGEGAGEAVGAAEGKKDEGGGEQGA